MPYTFYLFLLCTLIILSLTVFLVAHYKKNRHTELYKQGVRNENDGLYSMALQNYEDALKEIRKGRFDYKFGKKITQRIKILQTTIDYEKGFLNGGN